MWSDDTAQVIVTLATLISGCGLLMCVFTGQDMLRCLAMATVEQPGRPEEMNLEDAKNFVQYEVSRPLPVGVADSAPYRVT